MYIYWPKNYKNQKNMYLNNSYLMLVGFLKYCYQKIFKPKSLKDNIIGSFVGICIVFSLIVLYLRFFDL